MKKILIADANKASLVTTSEIFKDKYPGIHICTAQSSEQALEIAQTQENFDAFIIDFDLPDQNGAKTAFKLKKSSKTPVFITAFNSQDVLKTIKSHWGKFNDSKSFLKKPLHADIVHTIFEYHCKGNDKFQKHIACQLTAVAYVHSRAFIVSIVSCSLNTIKFTYTQTTETVSKANATKENIKKEKIAKIVFRDKDIVTLKFQNPYDIECGKKINLDQSASWHKSRLSLLLPFELTGRIVRDETTENSFLVEFENEALVQQIFESVVRAKVYAQLSAGGRLF